VSNGKFGPPAPLRGPDYEQIEAAVMETARGRWFLAEFARRNRTADTETLLKAIQRLQNALTPLHPSGDEADMRGNIIEIATAIAHLRHDLFSDSEGGTDRGTPHELSAIAAQIEDATHNILQIGERVQEVAWNLREQGIGAAPCDALDACAAEIFAACAFQDLTGQKMARLTGLLRMIEERLNGLIDRTGLDDIIVREAPEHLRRTGGAGGAAESGRQGAHATHGRPPARHITQIEIDALLAADQPFEPEPGEEIVFVDREDGMDSGPARNQPESSLAGAPANPLEAGPARLPLGAENAGDAVDPDDDDEDPPLAPRTGELSDAGAFDRLTADLRAATGIAHSAPQSAAAVPAAPSSPESIAVEALAATDAGSSAPQSVHDQDVTFMADAPPASGSGTGTAAKKPPAPECEPLARGAGQAAETHSSDPNQTNWDVEFNRLSLAHRMALFS